MINQKKFLLLFFLVFIPFSALSDQRINRSTFDYAGWVKRFEDIDWEYLKKNRELLKNEKVRIYNDAVRSAFWAVMKETNNDKYKSVLEAEYLLDEARAILNIPACKSRESQFAL